MLRASRFYSTKVLPPKSNVAVVGAGISGLSYAWYLAQLRKDLNITIIEQKKRVGGWIETSQVNTDVEKFGYVDLERGPRTLRGSSTGSVLLIDMVSDHLLLWY